ncbi:MAG: hypothetical protein IPN83_12500 [Holophagales bacterium]|nr:hypothetical protein [Holophagales bacterium]
MDDVVTKGAAIMGAAEAISTAMPACEITAFALVRTMGFVSDIDRLVDPCVGTIRFIGTGGDVQREP